MVSIGISSTYILRGSCFFSDVASGEGFQEESGTEVAGVDRSCRLPGEGAGGGVCERSFGEH